MKCYSLLVLEEYVNDFLISEYTEYFTQISESVYLQPTPENPSFEFNEIMNEVVLRNYTNINIDKLYF